MLTPPVSADYNWCIACQEFGHIYNREASSACLHNELERRCPVQYRNQAAIIAKPFVPVGIRNSSKSGTLFASPGITKTTNDRRTRSSFSRALETINENTEIMEKHGLIFQGPKQIKERLLELEKNSAAKSQSKKKNFFNNIRDPYRQRPSYLLSSRLAVSEWPQTQPLYTDLSQILEKDPIFENAREGDVFNRPGNFQSYFPSTRFRINREWREDAENDELFINKAGRLGLEGKCLRCGSAARIVDVEGDIVMCRTEPMCTMACGKGYWFWSDGEGREAFHCRCLPILGQQPEPVWVRPE